MSKQHIIKYFRESPEFFRLPAYYQYRIVEFFGESRHYFVGVNDVRYFLNRAKDFKVFNSFIELRAANRLKPIKRLLACNRHFTNWDDTGNWIYSITNFSDAPDYIGIVMTHMFGMENDEPEEWYIAGYY